MIYFQTCKWKNFLSTGDKFTEVQLDRSPTTLIVGHNGSGKSTLLDSISFALFGKAHRNINKPQLVNSINGKNCVVEVEFKIGKHQFKIVRGIKPGIFEIWQNGQMINQEANNRDYQKYLEKNILKLNHKSFHQIVVLGSSSFVPFMALPTGQRRDVIEDLLDINVFSKMNILLKEQISKTKEEIKHNSYQIDLLKERIDMQKKYIREITEINDEVKRDKLKNIDKTEKEIERLQNENSLLSSEIETVQSKLESSRDELIEQKSELSSNKKTIATQIKNVVTEAKFYESNDECPTCSQSIDKELKEQKISLAKSNAKELSVESKTTDQRLDEVEDSLQSVLSEIEVIREKQNVIFANNSNISNYQNSVFALKKEIDKLDKKDSDIGKANLEMSELVESKNDITEKKLSLSDTLHYYDVCAEMLRDTGIKTKIIKSYLPVMNQLINRYLQILDFFVEFNLDESFNETIRSRHRDNFTYSSFSEGEKSRLNLALLFTWRQIARMKNSVATNLLILDEITDSSLDVDGIDNLFAIINTLEGDTNVFVVSHRDVNDSHFRSKITFEKEKNFSHMKFEK